jgi:hypothetical protein
MAEGCWVLPLFDVQQEKENEEEEVVEAMEG